MRKFGLVKNDNKQNEIMTEEQFMSLYPEDDGYLYYKSRHGINAIHRTSHVKAALDNWGKFNVIMHHGYMCGNIMLGNNNVFYPHSSVGSDAESRNPVHVPNSGGYDTTRGFVYVGSNNIFREFTTVNSPTMHETCTRIGNNGYFMRGAHISHDTQIHDNVTLSCNALVGGRSILMTGANMGLGSICHPRTVIGPYALLGMNATLNEHASPFCIYVGTPAKYLKSNARGIEKFNITSQDIEKYVGAYKLFSEKYNFDLCRVEV